ncbi:MAG: WecB/TagA/CpsF family glycosyltransferase [Parvularculaceae bacterium]|nr:WecB/TagA/CpsF family glycosyltransferase [Parvularculaceae bacterium]
MISGAERKNPESQSGGDGGSATLAQPFARDDFDRDVWSVSGLPIDLATAPQAVEAIEVSVRDRSPLAFVTPNLNFLVRSFEDPSARREIIDSDLSLVDGAPLVLFGRLAGVPVKERCAGSDVFAALRLRPGFRGRRLRVFFFGGRDGAAKAAAEAVDREKRGVEAAGYLNPGHGDVESMSRPEIINEINAAKADFILVALGAAKGQRWIDRNRGDLDAPVIAHLGAVMDFAAGTIRRAPPILAKTGLEWAWRIKEEPALWRRYWRDATAFARMAPRLFRAALATRGAGSQIGSCRALESGSGAVIEMAGDLTVANRDLVRRAFRSAVQSAAGKDRPIILDFGGLRRIDASILGQLLMLEKTARMRGADLMVRNLSPQIRRLLAAHAMNYPETGDEEIDLNINRESIAAAI